MQLKESTVIDAPADAIWEYVGSPDVWPLFHAKATDSKQISSQGGVVGSQYEMRLRLGRKSSLSRCEIIEVKFGSMIKVKSTVGADTKGPKPTAEITYELDDQGLRTKVTERVDIQLVGMNIFLRMLVWFISRVGKPVGETSLMKLKRIVQQGRQ